MLRFMCCWMVLLTVSLATVAEADTENWYFSGVSPGIVLKGKGEPAGHVFIGAEGVLWQFFGYSADMGYVAHVRALEHGAGVLSGGGLLFPIRTQSVAVFITSGYTFGFKGGSAERANFLHTGLGTRLGTRVRLEVRNYVNFNGSNPNTHIWAFRVGLIF